MENNITVLLIEDELQIRRFLRATLTANNYRLIEAVTAQEGLTQAATHLPDLVILDLGLPDMDGQEVTRRLVQFVKCHLIHRNLSR